MSVNFGGSPRTNIRVDLGGERGDVSCLGFDAEMKQKNEKKLTLGMEKSIHAGEVGFGRRLGEKTNSNLLGDCPGQCWWIAS